MKFVGSLFYFEFGSLDTTLCRLFSFILLLYYNHCLDFGWLYHKENRQIGKLYTVSLLLRERWSLLFRSESEPKHELKINESRKQRDMGSHAKIE